MTKRHGHLSHLRQFRFALITDYSMNSKYKQVLCLSGFYNTSTLTAYFILTKTSRQANNPPFSRTILCVSFISSVVSFLANNPTKFRMTGQAELVVVDAYFN